MCNWSANFQLKRSKVKVSGRQKPQEIAAFSSVLVYLQAWPAAQAALAALGTDCKLGLTIVRPNLPLAPETTTERPHIMSALDADIFFLFFLSTASSAQCYSPSIHRQALPDNMSQVYHTTSQHQCCIVILQLALRGLPGQN